MKNKYFKLEKFIEFHRSVLHILESINRISSDSDLGWQTQKSYEKGWMDCLEQLENDMNNTTTEETLRRIVDEITKENK